MDYEAQKKIMPRINILTFNMLKSNVWKNKN